MLGNSENTFSKISLLKSNKKHLVSISFLYFNTLLSIYRVKGLQVYFFWFDKRKSLQIIFFKWLFPLCVILLAKNLFVIILHLCMYIYLLYVPIEKIVIRGSAVQFHLRQQMITLPALISTFGYKLFACIPVFSLVLKFPFFNSFHKLTQSSCIIFLSVFLLSFNLIMGIFHCHVTCYNV